MQTTSAAFQTAIKASTIYPVCKLIIETADGETYTLDKTDDIIGPLTVRSKCQDTGFEIGTVFASDCSVVLNNVDGRWTNKNLDGAILWPYSGVVLPDDSKEYVPLGKFVVDAPGRPYDQLELSASDLLIRLDEEFQYVNMTFPANNHQILTAISDYCNVPLAESMVTDNLTHIVNAAPDDAGLTCRDIVEMICTMAGGFGRMNRAGEFEIAPFPSLVVENIIEPVWSDLYLLNGSGDDFEIGGAAFDAVFGYQGDVYDMPVGSRYDFKQSSDLTVISGVSYTYFVDDVEQIMLYGTDSYLVEIPGIPILTHDIDTVIEGLYNKLVGLAYYAYSADYPGNPALDPGDAVRHVTRDGRVITSFIGAHDFTHGGSSTMRAEAPAKTAKKYKSKISRIISNLNTEVAGTVKQGQKYYGVSTSRETGIEVTGGDALSGIKAIFNSDNMGWFDSSGNFVGGMALVNSQVASIVNMITNDIAGGYYAKIGSIVEGGYTKYGVGLYKSGVLKWILCQYEIDSFHSICLYDENLTPRLSIDSDGGIILRDNAGRERWTTKSDGSFSVKDASGNVTVWSSYPDNFTKIFCPSASNMALGVDSGGPFKVKSGTKTYL